MAALAAALPDVPPAIRIRLARLGIASGDDLVLHLPLRYEDETRLYPIENAPQGRPVLVEGWVRSTEIAYRPRRQLVCKIQDASGLVYLRFFNFYPSQVKQLAVGQRVRCFGELRPGFFGAEMVHPRYRIVGEGAPVPDRLTPIYPTTAGLSQDTLRGILHENLERADLADSLPAAACAKLALMPFDAALRTLHAPPPDVDQHALAARTHPAWRRIKFDELLAQQLSLRLHRDRRRKLAAPRLAGGGKLARALIGALPFKLTSAQRRAIDDITRDLAAAHPMQRLLQGDVGSGKTIVAAIAALQAVESGYQVAVMAPTETLAEQHHRKFAQWLEPLGVPVAWLTGGMKSRERRAALETLRAGTCPLAVGTHALFQDEVEFARLGLAIVDEQHRFGVHQRLRLRQKGGGVELQPHQLMMSATPIPRTLAMSFYADLDVSVIDELPPGRTPVLTKLIAGSRRAEVVARVRDACLEGRQAYWVCPLIEDNEASESAAQAHAGAPLKRRSPGRSQSEALQLKTALATFEWVRETFPDLRVGLVHGRMPSGEKQAVMGAFKSGDVQLLVATTVIEVGMDVPNATLMVIENAERMGLAQLHQLRGRVGRGTAASACILMYQSPLSAAARERLKTVFEVSDGFEIARRDLLLRGPGEFLGARQSGEPMLRFADINADGDLLAAARELADELIRRDPDAVARHLERWIGERTRLLRV